MLGVVSGLQCPSLLLEGTRSRKNNFSYILGAKVGGEELDYEDDQRSAISDEHKEEDPGHVFEGQRVAAIQAVHRARLISKALTDVRRVPFVPERDQSSFPHQHESFKKDIKRV